MRDGVSAGFHRSLWRELVITCAGRVQVALLGDPISARQEHLERIGFRLAGEDGHAAAESDGFNREVDPVYGAGLEEPVMDSHAAEDQPCFKWADVGDLGCQCARRDLFRVEPELGRALPAGNRGGEDDPVPVGLVRVAAGEPDMRVGMVGKLASCSLCEGQREPGTFVVVVREMGMFFLANISPPL